MENLPKTDIWNKKSELAVSHIDAHIRNVYHYFKHRKDILEALKNNYPHSCITSLWEIVRNSNINLEHIESFDYLMVSYDDLKRFSNYKGNFNQINDHVNTYLRRLLGILNSFSFTLNDLELLTDKSGANMCLCGDFDLYEDKITFFNRKDWIRNRSCEQDYSLGQCYWKSYPYSSKPITPDMNDFNGRENDINVIFFPKSNWIQTLIYVKLSNNDEAMKAIEKYLQNMETFLSNDPTKTHRWDSWDQEHQKLMKHNVYVRVCKHSDLSEKLEYINQRFDIPLTQREPIVYDRQEEERYLKLLVKNNHPVPKFPRPARVYEPLDENMEYYWNEYTTNRNFLREVEGFSNISPPLYKFLTSKRFLDAHGSYDNPFVFWVNNKYYKRFSQQSKDYYLSKYTLSDVNYARLGEDNVVFEKYSGTLDCSHECPDPIYYRKLDEEELNELANKEEVTTEEFETLLIHNKVEQSHYNYDEIFEIYSKDSNAL